MSELREECGVVGVFSPRETYEIGRTVLLWPLLAAAPRTGELRNSG